jgi:hypothetical protein
LLRGCLSNAGCVAWAPCVTISGAGERPLTSAQAMELASVLVEAADELDRWITPSG